MFILRISNEGQEVKFLFIYLDINIQGSHFFLDTLNIQSPRFHDRLCAIPTVWQYFSRAYPPTEVKMRKIAFTLLK